MSTNTQPRQPSGTPVGGQFAGKANPEPTEDTIGASVWDFYSAYDDARSGYLPADFDQWDLADEDGCTVAHVAAYCGKLPPDFDQWDLANKYGWTVSHIVAKSGNLPPDFDQWDLADDKTGWTVAHAAARSGHLPPDFDRWDLADKNGLTVRQVAESKPPLREHDLESPLSQRA